MIKQLLVIVLLIPTIGFTQFREMGEIQANGFSIELMTQFYKQLEEIVTKPPAVNKHLLRLEDFFNEFSDSICMDKLGYKKQHSGLALPARRENAR